MRTCQTLIAADKYIDGSPCYKGDVNRVYTSTLVYRIEASVVKAPVGGKLFSSSDDALLRTMQKLKFGQIGALKTEGTEISGTEILLETIIPVQGNNVVQVKDTLLQVFDSEQYMQQQTCTINQKPIKLSNLKERLNKFRETNTEIRKRWIEKSKGLRTRGASSDEIKRQKAETYAEYVSISEYSIALSIQMVHIVNRPSLNATVKQNVNQAYYDAVNYKEGKVRKIATNSSPIVSIPICSLDDYQRNIRFFHELVQKSPAIAELRKIGMEEVYHEGSPNGSKVDFVSLKKHDQSIK
jgi:hypothetical protein